MKLPNNSSPVFHHTTPCSQSPKPVNKFTHKDVSCENLSDTACLCYHAILLTSKTTTLSRKTDQDFMIFILAVQIPIVTSSMLPVPSSPSLTPQENMHDTQTHTHTLHTHTHTYTHIHTRTHKEHQTFLCR